MNTRDLLWPISSVYLIFKITLRITLRNKRNKRMNNLSNNELNTTKMRASRYHPISIGIVSGIFAILTISETGFEYMTAYMFSILSVVSLLLALFTKDSTKK